MSYPSVDVRWGDPAHGEQRLKFDALPEITPLYAETCRALEFNPRAGQLSRAFTAIGRMLGGRVASVGTVLTGFGWALRASAKEQAARARVAAILGLPYDTHPAILAAKMAGQEAADRCRVLQQLSPADHHGESKPWRGWRLWSVGRHRDEPEPIGADWGNREPQWGDWGYP